MVTFPPMDFNVEPNEKVVKAVGVVIEKVPAIETIAGSDQLTNDGRVAATFAPMVANDVNVNVVHTAKFGDRLFPTVTRLGIENVVAAGHAWAIFTPIVVRAGKLTVVSAVYVPPLNDAPTVNKLVIVKVVHDAITGANPLRTFSNAGALTVVANASVGANEPATPSNPGKLKVVNVAALIVSAFTYARLPIVKVVNNGAVIAKLIGKLINDEATNEVITVNV